MHHPPLTSRVAETLPALMCLSTVLLLMPAAAAAVARLYMAVDRCCEVPLARLHHYG
jgi:hypothetical protein